MKFPVNKKRDCQNCESREANIFCDLPDAALDILNKTKILSSYKKGQLVFHAGNVPSGLYCVNSGVVRLEVSGNSGNNHILRVVRGGGILGYRSLFADEPYEASAVVHEEAQICLIPKSAIHELMKKFPAIGTKFLAHISKELRTAEARFCGLTDKNAAERVAEAVLFLKENFKEQRWTRKEIAEWASTTPETVMRSLSDFESEGLVALVGRKIEIVNKQGLSERANLLF